MKVIIYAVVTVLIGLGEPHRVMAQTVPADRWPQFSRDLTPPNAQDFFRAGQAQMEQEIRWLLEQRLTNLTEVLQVQSVTLPKDAVGPPPITPRPKPLEKS
jgi:hypothetical protein